MMFRYIAFWCKFFLGVLKLLKCSLILDIFFSGLLFHGCYNGTKGWGIGDYQSRIWDKVQDIKIENGDGIIIFMIDIISCYPHVGFRCCFHPKMSNALSKDDRIQGRSEYLLMGFWQKFIIKNDLLAWHNQVFYKIHVKNVILLLSNLCQINHCQVRCEWQHWPITLAQESFQLTNHRSEKGQNQKYYISNALIESKLVDQCSNILSWLSIVK